MPAYFIPPSQEKLLLILSEEKEQEVQEQVQIQNKESRVCIKVEIEFGAQTWIEKQKLGLHSEQAQQKDIGGGKTEGS